MRWVDLSAEVEKDPFVPFRMHMVSGKVIDVLGPGIAWMMEAAVLVFQEPVASRDEASRYDMIALTNIERIEQLP